MIRRHLVPAALALFGTLLSSSAANAVTFDFVALAAGNEHGAVSETFNSGGVSLTASGRNLTNTQSHFMYLDDLSGGNPGGLAVCKDLGVGECTPGEDDNLGQNEVLDIVFSQAVLVNYIEFSNGEHVDVYNGNFGVALDSTPTSVGAFTQYLQTAVFTTPLIGTKFSFISNATISGLGGDLTRQIYISKIDVSTQLPEPATLGLLGLALGAGALRRRNKKA